MSQITFRAGGPPTLQSQSGSTAHRVLPKPRHTKKLNWLDRLTGYLFTLLAVLVFASPYIASIHLETLWWWPNGWYR
jgi:hypothetical protein